MRRARNRDKQPSHALAVGLLWNLGEGKNPLRILGKVTLQRHIFGVGFSYTPHLLLSQTQSSVSSVKVNSCAVLGVLFATHTTY